MRQLILAALLASPASAGFITIDEFTDPSRSDHLGERTTDGSVTFGEFGVELGTASAVSGAPWPYENVATIRYAFGPSLVAGTKVRIAARNNQTNEGETGVLRASANGGQSIEYVLPGGQKEFVSYDFDFARQWMNPVAVIDELMIEWIRPPDATGARQLYLDSVSVEQVPEPQAWMLVAFVYSLWAARRLKTAGLWKLMFKRRIGHWPAKKRKA